VSAVLENLLNRWLLGSRVEVLSRTSEKLEAARIYGMLKNVLIARAQIFAQFARYPQLWIALVVPIFVEIQSDLPSFMFPATVGCFPY
jgi:hypothetical protein